MRRSLIALACSVAVLAAAAPANGQTVTPASHDFGQVKLGTESATQAFTLTNTGATNYPVTIQSSSDQFIRFAVDGLPACGVLSPGQSCGFGFRFFPFPELGLHTATVTTKSGSGGPTVTLTGTAIPNPGKSSKKKCKKGKRRAAAAKKKKCGKKK